MRSYDTKIGTIINQVINHWIVNNHPWQQKLWIRTIEERWSASNRLCPDCRSAGALVPYRVMKHPGGRRSRRLDHRCRSGRRVAGSLRATLCRRLYPAAQLPGVLVPDFFSVFWCIFATRRRPLVHIDTPSIPGLRCFQSSILEGLPKRPAIGLYESLSFQQCLKFIIQCLGLGEVDHQVLSVQLVVVMNGCCNGWLLVVLDIEL